MVSTRNQISPGQWVTYAVAICCDHKTLATVSLTGNASLNDAYIVSFELFPLGPSVNILL